jgi:hypothetical protein
LKEIERFFIYIGFNPAQLLLILTVFALRNKSILFNLHAVDAKAETGERDLSSSSCLQRQRCSDAMQPAAWCVLVSAAALRLGIHEGWVFLLVKFKQDKPLEQ